MSKSSRAKSKLKRLSEKRKRKAAQKAKYAAFAAAGSNTKSKRQRLKSKRTKRAKTMSHAQGKCGNIGCGRCNPIPGNRIPRSVEPLLFRAAVN